MLHTPFSRAQNWPIITQSFKYLIVSLARVWLEMSTLMFLYSWCIISFFNRPAPNVRLTNGREHNYRDCLALVKNEINWIYFKKVNTRAKWNVISEDKLIKQYSLYSLCSLAKNSGSKTLYISVSYNWFVLPSGCWVYCELTLIVGSSYSSWCNRSSTS